MRYSIIKRSIPTYRLSVVFCLLIIISIGACHQKYEGLPVQELVQLDSTVLGITTITSDLNVPWDLEWGPDNQIWFTQQSGTVNKVDPNTGKVKLLVKVNDVYRNRTLGMLGMAVSLDKNKPYVFIDYNVVKDSTKGGTPEWGISRLVRYTYNSNMDTLTDPFVLMEIPSAGPKNGHNGSRVAISSDGKVFWTTGEIYIHALAQDTSSPNGKILRLNMDGTIPSDNPFPDSPVWSYGHRNPQGLTFTANGTLVSAEHGDASDDELNIIQKGRNYGWPFVEGMCDQPNEIKACKTLNIVQPIMDWTPTIAPSGIHYYGSNTIPEWKNSILVATLKGMSIHVDKLNEKQDSVISEKVFFNGYFGRLRSICVSPDGDIYFSTSNRDWNPMSKPAVKDDRIMRIAKLNKNANLSQVKDKKPVPIDSLVSGEMKLGPKAQLYQNFCSSCHKMDGNGVARTFPNLNNNPIVQGDKKALINIVLQGDVVVPKSEKSKWAGEGGMPAFNFLKDQQVADIINYIRTSWENHSDTISLDDVKKIRQKIK